MFSEKDFNGILMLKIKYEMKGMKWRKIEQMYGMPHTKIHDYVCFKNHLKN